MDFATINGKTPPAPLPAASSEAGFDLQEQLSKGLVESFVPAIKMWLAIKQRDLTREFKRRQQTCSRINKNRNCCLCVSLSSIKTRVRGILFQACDVINNFFFYLLSLKRGKGKMALNFINNFNLLSPTALLSRGLRRPKAWIGVLAKDAPR